MLQDLESLIPTETHWDIYCTWKLNPLDSDLTDAWEVMLGDTSKFSLGLAKQLQRAVRSRGNN
jgi:hypothetical protein